ncbi:cobalt-precorrin-5B (C(1))-methyltransferase CbiD [Aminipila terrae]|uniref:Cobalt-precorrin-5B C(1)-methyltransferase n=1 Tax=Aminipila terrae TaxID=2697030 RepID=A0A6P1MPQ6_9FIRM|nr:cobalt-precorrin-5B (C(1))-methyltransferase CbiD [Aminipila terrae]QHI73646.1 cobalamin biosynthesis protein CbiD [Aminipila terrae]
MQEEKNKSLNPKEGQMRRGYTTGTCAAAAAKAAAMLSLGQQIQEISVDTPKGIPLVLDILDCKICSQKVSCAIKKDSGDDPDITNGILVYAEVELFESDSGEIIIDGGTGVGRVTLPGLACPVGQAAINPVPRKMIKQMVSQVFSQYGYEGGAKVTISIPEGEVLAKRTYNPRLGIEGGLSVLGTSGIVEPMSEQALIDTIKVEIDVRKALGAEYLVITPGNYGETFLKEYFTDRDFYSVKCSNFIGESLDYAEELGFKGVLFVGHMGKLVKVAGGIMNTHSKYADARMEIISAHIARFAGNPELIDKILNSVTTDNAYEVLESYSDELKNQVILSLMNKIEFHLKSRTHESMEIGAIMFSNKHGYLGKTSEVDNILLKI